MSAFEIATVDGMYIRQEVIPARTMRPQHAHVFDHSSLLARGRAILWRDDKPEEMLVAPAVIVIKAGQKHAFQALGEDVLLYCLHNLHGREWVEVLEEHDLNEILGADHAAA